MENLKEIRLELGYTQEEMAKACGVATSTYRLWEYGVPPSYKNLKKLKGVLANASARQED